MLYLSNSFQEKQKLRNCEGAASNFFLPSAVICLILHVLSHEIASYVNKMSPPTENQDRSFKLTITISIILNVDAAYQLVFKEYNLKD